MHGAACYTCPMDRDTDFKRKLYLQRLKHREGHRPRRTFAHGARERPGLQSPELLYDIVYEDREEHPILRCLPEGCGSVVLRRKFVSSTLWNKYEECRLQSVCQDHGCFQAQSCFQVSHPSETRRWHRNQQVMIGAKRI